MAVNSLERGPWANWVTGPALKRMRIGDEGYDPGEGISVECGGVSGQCRLRDGVSLTPTNKKPLKAASHHYAPDLKDRRRIPDPGAVPGSLRTPSSGSPLC